MKIITRIKCPVCGRNAEIIEFNKDSKEYFVRVIAECKCGVRICAVATGIQHEKKKNETILIMPLAPACIQSYNWKKDREKKLLNPSERY